MFDMLTLDDLYELHSALSRGCLRLHRRIMRPGSPHDNPRVKVYGPTWNLVGAVFDEMHETAEAVYAEIGRRNAERTPADA